MIIIFFFLLGLIIGSFLNVVVCRLQKEETLLGRSHCTKCERQIAWYDNVPLVSFVLLRGKCRHCKEAISWQYPLVELGTSLVFILIGRFVFSLADATTWIDTLFYLALFSMLIVVFVYDLLTMYIPMIMIWIALGWTSLYLALAYSATASQYMSVLPESVAAHIVSGIVAFFFFWVLVKVSNETWMGMGDAYLALLVGLVSGFPGVLFVMTLSFGIGAAVGMLLVLFGNKGMKSQVPFAPFLVIGLALVVLLPQMNALAQSLLLME